MSSFFLNRLLDVLHSWEDRSQVPLALEAKRDINWFTQFVPKFNVVIFFDHRPINTAIELNASLQGLGTRWGGAIYSLAISLGYMNLHIAHLEMLNILFYKDLLNIEDSMLLNLNLSRPLVVTTEVFH